VEEWPRMERSKSKGAKGAARRGSLYRPRTELGRVLVDAMGRWCCVTMR
jgi:hypothetical protein